jgi:RNA polymerase sigma-70 factor (ECF subfamily)
VAELADPFDVALVSAMPKLQAYARRLTRDLDAAHDLAYDTVARALHYRDRFTLGTNMTGWLCTICRNHFLAGKRQAWRSVPLNLDAFALVAPAPDDQHQHMELQEVWAALAKLPEHLRDAVLLAAEGHTQDELAELLGVPVGTVKSRLHRGRTALASLTQSDRRTR